MRHRLGSVLGRRYRLGDVLGSGGSSVVYRATHLWTGRQVAVKILTHPSADGPTDLKRFLLEARATAVLSHPNVVQVLDGGQDEDLFYLVFEHISGTSLSAQLRTDGCLSSTRALDILLPVADGLAEAHAAGILHRDIKPENVLVGVDRRGRETPKLIDFGIAALKSWRLTKPGELLGTPAYMSPEQVLGEGVGPGTDIWALGTVIYECVTGRQPFERTSFLDTLNAVVLGEHVPLHDYEGIAPGLADVVERALSVRSSERFATVDQMAEGLRAAYADLVATDGPQTLSSGLRRTSGVVPALLQDEEDEEEAAG